MRRFFVFCCCLGLASCENKYGDHPPYPASGQVLINGQPAKGVQVVLHHIDNWGERTIVPQGWTDEEGRFVLSTYAVDDGAPAGDYRVAIEWPAWRTKKIGPDKFGGRFAKPDTSGLTAHVEKGKNELPPFDLKVKVLEFKKP